MRGVPLADNDLLCRAIGDRVREMHRLFFQWQGELDRRKGDLTLVYESGKVFRFSGTPHGYGLRVDYDRWVDPFAEPLDEENRQWVEQCGKLVEVCVNEEDEWRSFIGRKLVQVGELVYIPHEEVAGLSLRFENNLALFVINLIDEVWVQRAIDPAEFREVLIETST